MLSWVARGLLGGLIWAMGLGRGLIFDPKMSYGYRMRVDINLLIGLILQDITEERS